MKEYKDVYRKKSGGGQIYAKKKTVQLPLKYYFISPPTKLAEKKTVN